MDKQHYYYISYIENNKLVMTKVNSETLEVKFFNRTYIETTKELEWQNNKIPN